MPVRENSIKYGLDASRERVEVRIAARKEDNLLVVSVEDNGSGMGSGTVSEAEGIGLSSTAERLDKLYGDDHKLSLEDVDGGGLLVVIRIAYRVAVAEEDGRDQDQNPRG